MKGARAVAQKCCSLSRMRRAALWVLLKNMPAFNVKAKTVNTIVECFIGIVEIELFIFFVRSVFVSLLLPRLLWLCNFVVVLPHSSICIHKMVKLQHDRQLASVFPLLFAIILWLRFVALFLFIWFYVQKSPAQMITSHLEICLVCVAHLHIDQWCALVIFPLHITLHCFDALLYHCLCSELSVCHPGTHWIYLLVCSTMHFCVMFSISLAWLLFLFVLFGFHSFYFRCTWFWEVSSIYIL